ncbi:MAG: ligand-binding SRPBCC domain-containing protein [Flavobacteriaceae bacterium]|jgi:ligand-binding SRPBCC domain-containing protein
MTQIHLETIIAAPIERVFDLSRSIDLHKLSAAHTNEEAIAGRTTGLIQLGENVTWKAKHLGIYQKLTVEIVQLDSPHMFEDRMTKGTFKSMNHIHRFIEVGVTTKMIDEFHFESPMGVLGKMVNAIFLKRYMTKFLIVRNEEIKRIAEGDLWKELLG